jgi:hypothetical protein
MSDSKISTSSVRTIRSHGRARSLLHLLEIRSGSKIETSYPKDKDLGVFAVRRIKAGTYISDLNNISEKLSKINDPCVNLTGILNATTQSDMYMELINMRKNYNGESNLALTYSLQDGVIALYTKFDIERGDELLRCYDFNQWLTEILDLLTGETVLGFCYFLHYYIAEQSTECRHERQLEKYLLHLLNIDHLVEDTDSISKLDTIRLYDGYKFNYSFKMLNMIMAGSHIMMKNGDDWSSVIVDDLLKGHINTIDQQIIMFERIILNASDKVVLKAINMSANFIFWEHISIDEQVIRTPKSDLRDLLMNMVGPMITRQTLIDIVDGSTPFVLLPTRNDINALLKMLLQGAS